MSDRFLLAIRQLLAPARSTTRIANALSAILPVFFFAARWHREVSSAPVLNAVGQPVRSLNLSNAGMDCTCRTLPLAHCVTQAVANLANGL
ncbi:hypothetical protein BV20DRAFT_376921 [Pilatotrama ljubarskyi]|nr:hypothetical protein BV20DRAFT_376921 [Pilatotrama ljubarskyi]